MRYGFFDVYIFARLDRPDRGERVPVVWRCDGHHIQILVLQHLPEIGVSFGGNLLLFQIRNSPCEDGTVHIAERGEPDALVLQPQQAADVATTAAVETDHAGMDRVARTGLRPRSFGNVKKGYAVAGGFDEGTAVSGFHVRSSGCSRIDEVWSISGSSAGCKAEGRCPEVGAPPVSISLSG